MIKGTKQQMLGPDPGSQREVFPGPPSGHWFSKGRSELLPPCVFGWELGLHGRSN